MNAARRSDRRCPQCGWAITRIARRPEERVAGQTPPIRRYRCCDAGGCGWEGTLAVTWSDRGAERRMRARARARMVRLAGSPFVFSLLISLAGIALGASGVKLYGTFVPSWLLTQSAGMVPFGESDFGQPLPENHPFLKDAESPPQTVKTAAVVTDSSAGADPAASSINAPLSLREGCAWGEPGRAPYKGTIQQALNGARLPPDVVAVLERKIQDHETSDVVEIHNDKILGLHSDAAFEPRAFKMTFAKTLCLNSRVNFKPGHVERADLYETTDPRGVTYSVMVPYVCGNISVLGTRAARGEKPPIVATLPALPTYPTMPSLPAPRAGPSGMAGTQGIASPASFGTPFNMNAVPEPETWTLMLGSFALLGWFTRRRKRGPRRR